MSLRPKRVLALLIAAPSAATALVCAGLLIHNYVVALGRAPADEQYIKNLTQAVKTDPAKSPMLAAEQDRQTKISSDRAEQNELSAHVLAIAVAVFLIGAKWRLALTPTETVGAASLVGAATVNLNRAATVRERDRGVGLLPAFGPKLKQGHLVSETAPSRSRLCAQDLDHADRIIDQIGRSQDALIPILQAVQAHYGYLPDEVLQRVCERTDISPAQLAGVASFYTQFRRKPAGRHLVRVCQGTACHVAGAEAVRDEIRRHLAIPDGDDTDAARRFTVESVACLGCCTLAPVVQIDGDTHGHLTPDRMPELIDEYLAAERSGEHTGQRVQRTASNNRGQANGDDRPEIRIGVGSCCVAGGSGKVYEALHRAASATGAGLTVKRVGCVGMCHRTPLVEVVLPGRQPLLYAGVKPEEASAIVRRHFPPVGLGRRMAGAMSAIIKAAKGNGTARPVAELCFTLHDPPAAAFLDRQKHIATEHCGRLDPTDFDEYVGHGGFETLRRCIESSQPAGIIDEIKASGLRGRGGGGFPTGEKWARVRAAVGDVKYVVCNGDEGDPGAFMDRMLMESFPYRVIEGLAIAARAVGASRGYFYIRREYPLAVRRIRNALAECRRRGLLGDAVWGSDFSLDVEVMEGAGAFVCGEETALLASLEGRRGTPRLRPPFPAENGLRGAPTLVNNVETFAVVPWIVRHGAAEFASLGTPGSKGAKVFALAGKVRRGGLIEVPMGVTVRQIVEEIGGGTRSGRPFKAVQIGGPSGGCVPAELADLPVDYEVLAEAGAIMGSGGVVVLDEDDCMVDIARYFLAFTQDQSCGKCTFCRIGTRRMLDVLDRICAGHGRHGDLEELEQLAEAVKQGSLCGLGRTAPNPVLSTLRYFRAEYEAHLQGYCPARKCKPLIHYRVTENCTGCTLCAQHCGADAIAFAPYQRHAIDDEKCTRCGVCLTKCPEDAIALESPCPV